MPRPVDTPGLTDVSRVLGGISQMVASVEEDLLSCLVVMGEPDAQHTVDAWVDQVVDLLRAVDEVTDHHLTTLSRVSTRHTSTETARPPDAATSHEATLPAERR